MADLATLQARLEELKANLGSAEQSVRLRGPNGEEEVIYRSTKELMAAIAAIESEIAGLSGPTIRTINVRSKGYLG